MWWDQFVRLVIQQDIQEFQMPSLKSRSFKLTNYEEKVDGLQTAKDGPFLECLQSGYLTVVKSVF